MSRCVPGAPGEESRSRTSKEQRQEGLEAAWYVPSRAGVGTWGQRGMAEKLEEVGGGQIQGP